MSELTKTLLNIRSLRAFARELTFDQLEEALEKLTIVVEERRSAAEEEKAALVEREPKLAEYAQMIEEYYLKGPFVLGDRFSFCDPYMALVTRWFRDDGVDLDQFAKIKEHDILMRQRPSMQHVLELHS